jgi:hypothetical protein
MIYDILIIAYILGMIVNLGFTIGIFFVDIIIDGTEFTIADLTLVIVVILFSFAFIISIFIPYLRDKVIENGIDKFSDFLYQFSFFKYVLIKDKNYY